MELPSTTKDISAQWLNEALRENGFLGRTRIASVRHEQIGIGEGFTSDIARIRVSYEGEAPHLRDSIIAKLPSSFEPARRVCLQLGLYKREINFYKYIAPSSPVRTPRCYFGEMDEDREKYVLLLEDCGGYSPADPELKGINYEQAKAITLAMADFHSRWWDDLGLSSFSWILQPNESFQEYDIASYRRMWESCSSAEEFRRILPKGGYEASKSIYERFHLLRDHSPQVNLTILHTDMKADNMYFDYANKEQPVIIIDWATTRVWRGVADISRLLGTSVETELRRECEKDLVERYFSRLVERGVSSYSYQECWEDYLKGYLGFSIFPLATFTIVDRSNKRTNEHAIQNLRRWFSAVVDNDATRLLP